MSPSPREAGPSADLLLLTCEHGGNDVPPIYAHLFTDAAAVLDTHRGYDLGALNVALRIASQQSAPLVFSTTTRLLIDLNRSMDSPTRLSEFSRVLNETDRAQLVDQFYRPYRENVSRLVRSAIHAGHRVVHVGIHSFTDVMHGITRELDLALLFDTSRPDEVSFCQRCHNAMLPGAHGLRLRFNEPYHGSDDGLTTTLRQHFAPGRYLGLEVEIRQGLLAQTPAQLTIADLLSDGLRQALV